MNRQSKAVALTLGGLGSPVLMPAGFAARDWILERIRQAAIDALRTQQRRAP